MLSEGGHKGKGPSIENLENVVDFIKKPTRSIIKGCPKTKRLKSGIELSTKARSCTTYPDKEDYV